MKHTRTRALYDYWNSLRDGRLAPYRSEIEPREIASLLDSTFILEVQSRESVRFRLAGTKLCENFGMELRGMSALALWHGECRSKVRDAMHRVVTEPCIGYVSCTVENRGGFQYEAEFLYMPLRSDMGDMTRILGCGYYMGEERAFAKLYDPIHHWINDVRLFELTGESFEGLAPPRPMPARRSSDSKTPITELESITAAQGFPAFGVPPQLTAIAGGRAEADRKGLRKRNHLRLVKSDAG